MKYNLIIFTAISFFIVNGCSNQEPGKANKQFSQPLDPNRMERFINNLAETFESADFGAIEEMKGYSKAAFPYLLDHLQDSRAAWTACGRRVTRASVGDVCFWLVIDQIICLPQDYRGSFGRYGSDGKVHERPYYLDQIEPFTKSAIKEWVEQRKNKTLREMQIEALEWFIAEEKK